MAWERNDDYRRAIDAVSIPRLWEVAFAEGAVRIPPPTRGGLSRSPFRDDGARESFSILGGGSGFKDHGGDGVKGGKKRFAELCWPNLDRHGLAEKIIEISGIIRTPARQASGTAAPAAPAGSAPGQAAAAAVVPDSVLRAAKSIEKRQRAAEAEERVYAEREKLLRQPEVRWSQPMPDFVRERWEEGMAHMRDNPKRIVDLARDRGWPEAWAWALLDLELVSYPWERPATPGAKFAGRQKAFLVQEPRMVAGHLELVATGYHQRFFVPAAAGQAERKGWLYLPSVPKFRARSAYEESLLAYGKAQGLEPNDGKSLVLPAPFVLGDLINTQLIVILEGQWDAVTLAGALGWLHDTTPAEGAAVFGIRGAQGLDAFLGLWWPWLQRKKPRAWLLADNDAAGGTWRDRKAAEVGLPQPPTVGERLAAAGCREPVVSWLKRGPWGKDFNDYFRHVGGADKLTPAKMLAWMGKLGLVDRSGRWA